MDEKLYEVYKKRQVILNEIESIQIEREKLYWWRLIKYHKLSRRIYELFIKYDSYDPKQNP